MMPGIQGFPYNGKSNLHISIANMQAGKGWNALAEFDHLEYSQ